MQDSIERAIETMWHRYDEPLSLSELAASAFLSKFYFSRAFRALTGTSPGRYLAAIRLFKAKSLLLKSSMSVTDISYGVGYNSLGTFTSRFTRSVTISPARYRAEAQLGMMHKPPAAAPATAPCSGVVRGLIDVPATDVPMRVYIGAFSDPIPQRVPGACDIVGSSGPFQLTAVPDGTWYVRGIAVATQALDPRPWNRRPLFVGGSDPVEIRGGTATTPIELRLRPSSVFDPPILLALPELDSCMLPEYEVAA
jgi:AraC-like DNA-binding protein